MHPEDQSFRESGEFATRMHNSWAKHNLTFKFHVLVGPFPSASLSLFCPALRRALIIGYLVITDDTFFLVADIARNLPWSYINLSFYRLRVPGSRPKSFPAMQTRRSEMFLRIVLFSFLDWEIDMRTMLGHTGVRSCNFTKAFE